LGGTVGGVQVVREGEPGDYFYIIKEGEAVVFQTGPAGRQHKVNHLFRADFFGEHALLVSEPRMATVSAVRQHQDK
jgi:cGMP-dependent protein kinase 2